MKVETVEKYLARGGKIIKVAPGEGYEPLSFVGPGDKAKENCVEKEDYLDGNSPNLEWIGA